MSSRRDREWQEVRRIMPNNTRLVSADGRDIWLFKKNTEVGIEFEIGIYYDPDEDGYCAQLVSPEVESSWKNAHVGHLFADGVICMGGSSMRTRRTLKESFSKSCLWAEGMALMIVSYDSRTPIPFPFSNNNSESEAML